MNGMSGESEVVALSIRQLSAYNAADLDAFCACYHPDVRVLEADGTVRTQGMDAFRARYAGLFSDYRDVRAEVDARLTLGPHVVEHERWERTHRQTGEHTAGEVLVRYTARDGRIALVAFLMP
jgi:uncharacterized protein (TIGR02246 family)